MLVPKRYTIFALIVFIFIESLLLINFLRNSPDLDNSQSTRNNSVSFEQNGVPPLYTEGNQIFRTDTDQPIILRGALSDFFRFGYNKMANQNLEGELGRLNKIKALGANIIGLYLSDFPKIQENLHNLDIYVNHTGRIGMYIYLIPVARNFTESYVPVPFEPEPENSDDLTMLIKMLASRYKDKPHVMFGFGAEPDIPNENFPSWHRKQKELAEVVRNYSDNAILLISGTEQYDLSGFETNPFADKNIIYISGGYLGIDDANLRLQLESNPEYIENVVDYWTTFGSEYPIILGEFGGNVERDFSSDLDIFTLDRLLNIITRKSISYTVYRLGPNFPEGVKDPLGMFDAEGNLTVKGEIVAKYLTELH